MSVAVCRGPVVPPAFQAPCWLKPAEPVAIERRAPPAQVDIWNAIQADVDATKAAASAPSTKPYVHPLVRRSSSRLLSQKSLEVCTESLGNETGSGDFTSSLDDVMAFTVAAEEEPFWENDCDEEEAEECEGTKGLIAVNYHCSAGARRAFPPPLPSMSRRDGPCLQMRPRREAGRLVVEAVAVRPRGFLHATRQGGRLRLAFVECSASARDQSPDHETKITPSTEAPFFPAVENDQNEQEEEDASVEMEEEEEEVEVVDRGTVVEVKVSTQPQTPTAGGKVHRSRLVINKFVGSTPLTVPDQPRHCHNDVAAYADGAPPSPPKLRRVPSSTTTLAAAVAEASTGTGDDEHAPEEDDDDVSPASAAAEPKQLLLFTSRRGDKQDILQSVRRCRQLRQKPLFILEPYCIATT